MLKTCISYNQIIYEYVTVTVTVTSSGVRAYMVKMYLKVEMYTIFDDFIRIHESGIKKTTWFNFVTV
jgi:hypothetical protein